MIIWKDDEENPFFLGTSIRYAENTQPRLQGNYSELNLQIQNVIADIKSDIYHKTVGYGLIAVGAGVLVATRGVGWKPAALIMSTGLNNLAEASE